MPDEEGGVDPIREFVKSIEDKYGSAEQACVDRGLHVKVVQHTTMPWQAWQEVGFVDGYSPFAAVHIEPPTDSLTKIRVPFVGGPCDGCLHVVNRSDSHGIFWMEHTYHRLDYWGSTGIDPLTKVVTPGVIINFFYCGDPGKLTPETVTVAIERARKRGWKPEEAM